MIEAVCIKYIYLYIRIQIYFNRIQYLTYQGMDAYMPSSLAIFFFSCTGHESVRVILQLSFTSHNIYVNINPVFPQTAD